MGREVKVTMFVPNNDPEIDSEGDEKEFTMPARWVICGQCGGEGNCNPPGLRGHCYTADEIERDGLEPFLEDLASGVFHETCEKCDGKGRRLVVDASKLDPETRKLWVAHVRSENEDRAESYRETYMERGMAGDLEGMNLLPWPQNAALDDLHDPCADLEGDDDYDA